MTFADMLDLAASRTDAWFNLWQLYFLMTSTVLIVVSATPVPFSSQTNTLLCGMLGLATIGFATAFWSSYDVRFACAVKFFSVPESEIVTIGHCIEPSQQI